MDSLMMNYIIHLIKFAQQAAVTKYMDRIILTSHQYYQNADR